jgi:hypothetical protein
MQVRRPEVTVELDEVGPNGGRVEYRDNGDLVEWVTDDDCPTKAFPVVLIRGDESIREMHDDLLKLVSLGQRLAGVRTGKRKAVKRWRQEAKKVQIKWDLAKMKLNDFDWGVLSGRFSALAWMLGAEWEWSLDT